MAMFRKIYWQTDRKRETYRDSSLHCFTPQMTVAAWAWPEWNQEPGTPSQSPTWMEGIQGHELSSAVFPGTLVRSWTRSKECLGLEPVLWYEMLGLQVVPWHTVHITGTTKIKNTLKFRYLLFEWQSEREREEERDREAETERIFYLWILFPSGCCSCAWWKPGA